MAIVIALALASPALGASITEFPLPYTNFEPYLIVKGPDNALYSNPWPSLPHPGQTKAYPILARITPQGQVSDVPRQDLPLHCPVQPSRCTGATHFEGAATGLATGPDGNLWFTDFTYVDKISPAGTGDMYYTGTFCGGGNGYSNNWGIAPGVGNSLMWFADEGRSGNCPDPSGAPGYGGLISTDGSNFKETQGSAATPVWITAGPNNDAYWTEQDVFGQAATPMLGHMTSSGAVNEIQLPPSALALGITLGPDSNIWFVDQGNNAIGEYFTAGPNAGKIKEYSAGLTPNAGLFQITNGPDGRLYFTEPSASKIGAIAPSGTAAGTITEYGITSGASPFGIATGPDKNIWFTEFYNNAIGRLSLGNGTISGKVTDADEKGLSGIVVTAHSSSGSSQSATTGSDGSYSMNVPSGSYAVSPNGSPPGSHPGTPWDVTQCDGSPATSSCTVDVSTGDVKHASFGAPMDKIDFHFTPLGTPAAGNGAVSGGPVAITNEGPQVLSGTSTAVASDTTLTDRNGNSISGGIRFTALESPRAVVCTPTGLAFPQLDAKGNPTGVAPFDKSTSPIGHVLFTIYAGNEEGPWGLDARELNRNPPAVNSTALHFSPARRQGVGGIAQRFYNLAKTITGKSGETIPIFNLTNTLARRGSELPSTIRNADQAVLLAFLQKHFSDIGTDFGPIHTSDGSAGVEFYAGGQGVVLDTDTAASILAAASADTGVPLQARNLPPVSQYEQAHGVVVPGHLNPDPSDSLTYFGFPYPSLSDNGAVDSQFSNNCVKPDRAQMNLEVDSPLSLVFTNSFGQKFGISPKGKPILKGPGFEQPFRRGKTRRFVLPAGTYKVSLTGTGKGIAHVAVFSPGTSRERTQVFTFKVKKGQKGTLKIGPNGARGVLRFGGHRYRARPGFRLKLHSKRKLKHGRTRTLVVHVADEIGRPLPGAIVMAREGRRVLASAIAGTNGTVKLTLHKLKKGKLKIKVIASGTLGGHVTIKIR